MQVKWIATNINRIAFPSHLKLIAFPILNWQQFIYPIKWTIQKVPANHNYFSSPLSRFVDVAVDKGKQSKAAKFNNNNNKNNKNIHSLVAQRAIDEDGCVLNK